MQRIIHELINNKFPSHGIILTPFEGNNLQNNSENVTDHTPIIRNEKKNSIEQVFSKLCQQGLHLNDKQRMFFLNFFAIFNIEN